MELVLRAVELHMKKCCNRILIPKISYRASLIDSIGLVILLSFFLAIVSLIAFGAASWLVYDIQSGKIGERDVFGIREGGGGILLLFGIYKLLPKAINAFSFLVNYKLKITGTCKHCGLEHVIANYPTNNDPF